MKIIVKYYMYKTEKRKRIRYYSHSYTFEYKKCDYCCIGCGKKEVYKEQGEGDYYVGSNYICGNCGTQFNAPFVNELNFNDTDGQPQIYKAIKKKLKEEQ